MEETQPLAMWHGRAAGLKESGWRSDCTLVSVGVTLLDDESLRQSAKATERRAG